MINFIRVDLFFFIFIIFMILTNFILFWDFIFIAKYNFIFKIAKTLFLFEEDKYLILLTLLGIIISLQIAKFTLKSECLFENLTAGYSSVLLILQILGCLGVCYPEILNLRRLRFDHLFIYLNYQFSLQ